MFSEEYEMDLACLYVFVFLFTGIALFMSNLKTEMTSEIHLHKLAGTQKSAVYIVFTPKTIKIILDRLWVWALPATWRCIYVSRSQFKTLFSRSTSCPTAVVHM